MSLVRSPVQLDRISDTGNYSPFRFFLRSGFQSHDPSIIMSSWVKCEILVTILLTLIHILCIKRGVIEVNIWSIT